MPKYQRGSKMDSADGLLMRATHCETHGEFTQRGIPVFDKTIWSKCPACIAIQNEQDEAKKRFDDVAKAQSLAESRLLNAGVPTRFRDRTIDSFVAENPDQVKAKEIALEFTANFQEHRKRGTPVVFSGNPGTGKSHLAIAMLTEVMKNGTGMYLNALDLVRMVRDTWRRDSTRSETQVLDALGKLDLLVIDEVGVQYGTEGEQVVLFDVLNRRYRDCMPTIMLTNLKAAEFEEYIGARAFDRLKEGGIWLRFAWESHRGKR